MYFNLRVQVQKRQQNDSRILKGFLRPVFIVGQDIATFTISMNFFNTCYLS